MAIRIFRAWYSKGQVELIRDVSGLNGTSTQSLTLDHGVVVLRS